MSTFEDLRARKAALLTTRERAQLQRAQALLDRIRQRQCRVDGVKPGSVDENPIAESAHIAEARIELLIEADDNERLEIDRDVEQRRFQALLDAEEIPGLRQAVHRLEGGSK